MEREVLGKRSPLFGRRTGQIFLQPFGFQEVRAFVPSWSLAEVAKAYFVLGGIPLYLRALNAGVSMERNIEDLLLTEHAPLFREPDFLLREELREVDTYYGVLLAMAKGAATPSAIAAGAGVAQPSLPYYLNQLVALGYVGKRYPLSAKKPSARSVRYAISDPLLRFWFRFVFSHPSFILQEGAQRSMRELIKPELPAYYGTCFEALCREALPLLYRDEGLRAVYEVGEYWDKTVQIDVVGHRDDGWVDLGECKWGSYGGQAKVRRELDSKIDRYPNEKGATIGRRFFVQQRPKAVARAGERWHGLRELYQAGMGG
jgi:AAA+ ATPase superfamily predicted ATPase